MGKIEKGYMDGFVESWEPPWVVNGKASICKKQAA